MCVLLVTLQDPLEFELFQVEILEVYQTKGFPNNFRSKVPISCHLFDPVTCSAQAY